MKNLKSQSEFNAQSLLALVSVFVAVSVSGALFASSAISVFIGPISQEVGWGRGQISGATGLLFLGIGLGSPFFGRLVDRFGPRMILLPLTAASGFLLTLFSFSGNSLPLFLGGHFLLGLATPGAVAYSKLISAWFFKRRGIAFTAVGTGAAVGMVLIPQVAAVLLKSIGWQHAYLFFGLVELFVALPILILFFRERRAQPDSQGVISKEIRPDGAPHIRIVDALRGKTYWLVVAAQLAGTFAQLAIGTHFIGILTERGIGAASATLGISVFAIGGLVAQPITGFVLDKFNTPRIIALFSVLSIAALSIFFLSRSTSAILVGALLLGIGLGGQTSVNAYFTSRFFGVRNFSTIYGFITPALMILAAPAPVIVGLAYDKTGSYALGLDVIAAVVVASLGLFLILPRYPYPTNEVKATPSGDAESTAPAKTSEEGVEDQIKLDEGGGISVADHPKTDQTDGQGLSPEEFAVIESRAKTYEAYVAGMTSNVEAIGRKYDATVLDARDFKALTRLNAPIKVFALVEDWCPDVIANLPIFARIAEGSALVSLFVLPRPENPAFAAAYPGPDIRSSRVPTYVVFDQQGRQKGVLVERPVELTEILRPHIEKVEADLATRFHGVDKSELPSDWVAERTREAEGLRTKYGALEKAKILDWLVGVATEG